MAATIETLQAEILALRADVKNLAKMIRKVRSVQDDPTGEKTKARSENNGFNRALGISDKLREFLGTEEGQLVSRSEVTRRVNQYIKANNLKHPDNGRIIILDDKLTDLLAPPEGVQVTFLNMQKYISPHYVKTADPSPTDGEASTSAPEPTAEAPAKKVVKRPVVRKPKTPTAAA